MNDDITDPNHYLNTFEEGIKRFFSSSSAPTNRPDTASPLPPTGPSTAPLTPPKLPSLKNAPVKTPDSFTHRANDGIDLPVSLTQHDSSTGHTPSRPVTIPPASPAPPVTPDRSPAITTARLRPPPVDKAQIADSKTDAIEYGDEGRSRPSRPSAPPDYAAAAANEGFVPIVDGSLSGSSVSKAEKERIRQYGQAAGTTGQ